MTSMSYTYGIAIVHCVLQITHTAKQMIRECVVTVSQSQTDTHAPWAPPMGIDLAPRNYVGGGGVPIFHPCMQYAIADR